MEAPPRLQFGSPCSKPLIHPYFLALFLLVYPILSGVIPQAVPDELSLAEFVRSATSERLPPAQTVRTRQTPIKPNTGTSLTQSGTHPEVDPRVRAELRGLTFPNTPGFMDAFFSPYQSKAAEILQLPEFVDQRSGARWTRCPRTADPGPFEQWYLRLANQVLAAAGLNRQYAASPSKALTGHNSTRKPDLILIPAPSTAGAIDWSDVLVVGEMKKGLDKSLGMGTIVQLANYIRIMFATQHNRRFIHGFTFCGDLMQCWVFHRGGAMGGDEFSINGDPQLFLSVILGYAAMNYSELGFDPTLSFGHEGILVGKMHSKITVARPAFFCPGALASRGTTCWNASLVTDPSVRYVLKDSWRSVKHNSEGEMLAKARDRGVVGIVKYIAHEDVMIDGQPDNLFANVMKGLQVGKAINMVTRQSIFNSWGETSEETQSLKSRRKKSSLPAGTQQSRKIGDEDPSTPPTSVNKDHRADSLPVGRLSAGKRQIHITAIEPPLTSSARKRVKSSSQDFQPFNRIHTRLLTAKGRNITDFTSIRELLLAFYGAITGHLSLYENGILHRDVSINNIMMTFPDQSRPDGLMGFLIDLDLAIETSDIHPSGAPHRTGTMEFMAIGVLRGDVQTFRHDLESFFYVFLWVCIHYPIFPEPESKANDRVWKTDLDLWGSTFEIAARTKWGDMGRAAIGSGLGLERILEKFEGWAIVLHGLARRIRDILFPIVGETMGFSEGLGVYSEILKVLQEHVDKF